MITIASTSRTNRIARRDLEQFRQSIESWERHGREAGRDGDVELAAGYAEDVADLRTILRLIEIGELHEAAEVVDCLDTVVRDQSPIRLRFAVSEGSQSRTRFFRHWLRTAIPSVILSVQSRT